jgi:hypothetical protein
LEDGKSELAVDWEDVENGGEDGRSKVIAGSTGWRAGKGFEDWWEIVWERWAAAEQVNQEVEGRNEVFVCQVSMVKEG